MNNDEVIKWVTEMEWEDLYFYIDGESSRRCFGYPSFDDDNPMLRSRFTPNESREMFYNEYKMMKDYILDHAIEWSMNYKIIVEESDNVFQRIYIVKCNCGESNIDADIIETLLEVLKATFKKDIRFFFNDDNNADKWILNNEKKI